MKRIFLPPQFKVTTWNKLNPYYKKLLDTKITDTHELKNWLLKRSELSAVLEEELAWRYIKMNCDTTNKKLASHFNYFVTNIEPNISKAENELDKKLIALPAIKKLTEKKYLIMLRSIKKKLELFNKKNLPIIAELQKKEQEYGIINSQMTVKYKKKEYTLQQAAKFLHEPNRNIRQKLYKLINERRLQDAKKLNTLLDSLLVKRHTIAKNAGFTNYRDYRFNELGRFDYTIADCEKFHDSISSEVLPLINKIMSHRKKSLNLADLKPWDLEVDIENKPPLQPFKTSKELIEKSIACFNEIRPLYGEYLKTMKQKGFLDLDSRKGKAPGGFNYPLYESNIPFIFMNAAGTLRDVETLMHEGGHAIHAFLSKHHELIYFKNYPSEVAELASMAMELISMEHWHIFFKNKDDLKRAKRSQLEGVMLVLPWVATIDKFQHWLYTHPKHTIQQRTKAWLQITSEFSDNIVNRKGCEKYIANNWQKQLHIFEVPFYYIEYGIAQLGAIAIWKNYKKNPNQTLNNYEKALSLGYTKTIPEIYKTAGIQFNFSKSYIKELMSFIQNELDKLY